MRAILEGLAFVGVVFVITMLVWSVAGNPFHISVPLENATQIVKPRQRSKQDCFPKDYEARVSALDQDTALSTEERAKRRLDLLAENFRVAAHACPDLFSPIMGNRPDAKEWPYGTRR